MNKKETTLKRGDKVMVIAGGNKTKRPNKGQVGQILSFQGADRVIVEGVNLVTKHKRATKPGEESTKMQIPAAIHVSNVMFYSEKLKKPVRLKKKMLEDGQKVRGFIHPESGEFEQI
ncbi:50S ribosomal protein L24 [bacterium]|jgi:large subunit ribosomal protein L24|nr:50S ribosomal protein L24 [bacterium]